MFGFSLTYSLPIAVREGSFCLPSLWKSVCFSASLAVLSAPALLAETAKPANTVADAVGVNTHFGVVGSPYGTNSDLLVSYMHQMGVHHFRDGVVWLHTNAPFPTSSYEVFNRLGGLGINGDYILNANMTPAQISQALGQIHNAEATEYPNEYDVAGDPNWASTLRKDSAVFFAAAKPASSGSATTLVGPSLVQMNSPRQLGDVSMDVGNLHAYFNNYAPDLNYRIGSVPGANAAGGPCAQDGDGNWVCFPGLKFLINNVQPSVDGRPLWITETGYQTTGSPAAPGQSQYVPGNYLPAYYVREVLWALNNNIPRVYFYSLLDDAGDTYGLVDSTLRPKPSFYALSNLIHLMDDPGSSSFKPGDLPYSLNSSNRDLMHSLFQKSDGTFYLALWLAESTWDGAKDITPAPVPVSLSVAGHTILGTYTMQQNGVFKTAAVNKSQASLQVGTSPVFVRIQ